jgi:hypothetical protein
MAKLTFEGLRTAVANHTATRRVQRLQPAGGPGIRFFPRRIPESGLTIRRGTFSRPAGSTVVMCGVC